MLDPLKKFQKEHNNNDNNNNNNNNNNIEGSSQARLKGKNGYFWWPRNKEYLS